MGGFRIDDRNQIASLHDRAFIDKKSDQSTRNLRFDFDGLDRIHGSVFNNGDTNITFGYRERYFNDDLMLIRRRMA